MYRSLVHWVSADFWRGRRVLVTGASGFIGTWVADLLVESEAEVYAIGHTQLPTVGRERARAVLPQDADKVIAWAQAEVVFHLAAPILLESSAEESVLEEGIVHATSALLTAIEGTPTRFVYTGSCAEYGEAAAPYSECSTPLPGSPYGRAKLAATELVRAAGHTVVRPFRAIGAGDTRSVVAAAARAALSGEPFEMTTGEQVREWNHVGAIARGIIAAGAHDGALGRIVNLGGGETASVRAVVEEIFTLAEANLSALKPGARPHRAGEVPLLAGDHQCSRSLWGDIPQPPLTETLTEALSWTRRQQDGAA